MDLLAAISSGRLPFLEFFVVRFGLVHGSLGGADFVRPRTVHHLGQHGPRRRQLAFAHRHVCPQIGRFQFGDRLAGLHRLAFVEEPFRDVPRHLETDGHLDGLDVAGDAYLLVAGLAELQRPPAAGADSHYQGHRRRDD